MVADAFCDVLRDVARRAAGRQAEALAQRHEREGGFTDIEIRAVYGFGYKLVAP